MFSSIVRYLNKISRITGQHYQNFIILCDTYPIITSPLLIQIFVKYISFPGPRGGKKNTPNLNLSIMILVTQNFIRT